MDRRTHIKKMAALAGTLIVGSSVRSNSMTSKLISAAVNQGSVMTVTGEISPSRLGLTLPHEHLFSTMGKDPARYPSYPEKEPMDSVVPYLKKVKKLGIDTIVDATQAFSGRQPEYLRKISEETGVQIITNTGYYGAASGKYVPDFAAGEPAEQIAERWLREINRGIDETGIYPGFVATATDTKPLSPGDKKLIKAAAICHRKTGLPIQTEVGNNIVGANDIIAHLSDNNVSAEAWTWIHADKVPDPRDLVSVGKMGSFISFDGLNEENTEKILGAVKIFKQQEIIDRVLLSHSGNSFQNDGSRVDFHYLVTGFKPKFLAYGFTKSDFKQITETNPANALTIKKRLL